MRKQHSFQQLTNTPPVFLVGQNFSRQSRLILRNDKLIKESLPSMFLKVAKQFENRKSVGDLLPLEMMKMGEKKINNLQRDSKRKSRIIENSEGLD